MLVIAYILAFFLTLILGPVTLGGLLKLAALFPVSEGYKELPQLIAVLFWLWLGKLWLGFVITSISAWHKERKK